LIGFLYSEEFLKHNPGVFHPDKKERLISIVEKVRNSDEIFDCLKWIKPVKANKDLIEKIHTRQYIDFVEEKCQQGGGLLDYGDTVVNDVSFEVASLVVGGVVKMAKKIVENEFKRGFCAVRPTGHHAERDRAGGFCIFNHTAIAAKVLIDDYNLNKIAIVDWDVHHGNGTEQVFYSDPRVFFISLHQFPFYPGTGLERDTGEWKGKGYNLNFPMKPFSGSKEYCEAFGKISDVLEEYQPQFIFISAGFDAHKADSISTIQLKSEDYGKFTRILMDVANKYSDGRILSVLEGGYNLKSLSDSIYYHLKELI